MIDHPKVFASSLLVLQLVFVFASASGCLLLVEGARLLEERLLLTCELSNSLALTGLNRCWSVWIVLHGARRVARSAPLAPIDKVLRSGGQRRLAKLGRLDRLSGFAFGLALRRMTDLIKPDLGLARRTRERRSGRSPMGGDFAKFLAFA